MLVTTTLSTGYATKPDGALPDQAAVTEHSYVLWALWMLERWAAGVPAPRREPSVVMGAVS